MNRFGAALCLAFAAACIPTTTKTEITNTVPDNPTGAVGGIALDYFAGTPLSGATVTLFTGRGKLTATTDADGFYGFPEVPVGSFTAVLNVTGYGPAVLVGTLDSQDPNSAVKNPQTTLNPIGLIKLDQTFSVRVVDEAGNPVAGAVLSVNVPIQFVEWTTNTSLNNGVTPSARGNYIVTSTSGADGTAAIAGLPPFAKLTGILNNAGNITIGVAPILVTGSTVNYSFNGGDFAFNVLNLDEEKEDNDLPTIVLGQPDSDLKIVKSSVEYLEGSTGGNANIKGTIGAQVAGAITVQFNNTIAAGVSTVVHEVEENLPKGQAVFSTRVKVSAVSFTPDVKGNVLTLTPATAPVSGKSYWLTLTVQAAQKPGAAARTLSVTFPFWGAIGTAVTVADSQLLRSCSPGTSPTDVRNTDTIRVLFSEPIGTGTNAEGNPNPSTFTCAVYYAGAEFNGSTSIATVGEDGMSIICEAGDKPGQIKMIAQPTPGAGVGGTGFSKEWEMISTTQAYFPACTATANACTGHSRPTGAARITFKFQSGDRVVRRLNGNPVDDIAIEQSRVTTQSVAPASSCDVT